MEENENVVTETEIGTDVSETASSDDDWDDVDLSDVRDEEDTPKENDSVEDDGGDQTENAPDTPEPENAQTEKAPEEQTDRFTLKHLDEIRTVDRDEVITLAQKGMDYDRLKSKLDERTEKQEADAEELEIIRALAKEQGVSVSAFTDGLRAAVLSRREGISLESANERIRLERKEAELTRREARLSEKAKEAEKAEASKKAADEKRDRDVKEFLAEYPDVKFDAIPKEVWADVSAGKTLVDAYRKHENEKLREELAAAKKNAENAARSTGSRKGAGKQKADPYFDGWYDD